tara:strand:+ start:293 stop:1468 length:1176 start_codon:yes stop_codon:yes gene_type:complete
MLSSIPQRGFSQSEFEHRAQKAQRVMNEEKLDAILLTTEPNVRYFSGFLTQFWQSPTRPWFLIVPREGELIAVIPEIGRAGMESTWVNDIRTWGSPCPEDDGITLLAQALSEVTVRFGRIGMTLGQESHLRMPANNFKQMTEKISPTEIVDVALHLHSLKKIKSEAEIQKIEHICQITSGAFENLPSQIRIGETQRQICLKLRQDILKRGGDNSPYLIAGSGSGGYDNIIMGPTESVLENGHVLIIDTGSTFDGYFCDFDRNFAFGNLPEEARRAYETVYRATDVGIESARPGKTTTDVWQAMWSVLEKGGALGNSVGRMGHGLGMELTEWPSVMPGDDTLLEPGMVLTIEPGMSFAPGKEMVHEENILITEEGARILTRRAPAEMPIILN